MSILRRAIGGQAGFKMLNRDLDSTIKNLRYMGNSTAQMVGRYRDLAGRRDLEHPDASRGMAPPKYPEAEDDIKLMARAIVLVRMGHDLADHLEKLKEAT